MRHLSFHTLILGLSLGFLSCAHQELMTEVKPNISVSAKERRDVLIGKWYGEVATAKGTTRRFLTERRDDGTFTAQFQVVSKDQKKLEQVEAGYWGVAGDVYFTLTREMMVRDQFKPVNVKDGTYYDAYSILRLDKDAFSYKAVDTKDEYSVKRVSKNFSLK